MSRAQRIAVIGAGVTGLAIGSVSGVPIFEQSDGPGGICRSYYLVPGAEDPLDHAPPGQEAYRFEVGGGHWIFGGDPVTISWLEGQVDFRVHERRAVVRLGSLGLTVPYPLQAHAEAIGAELAQAVKSEIAGYGEGIDGITTLQDWLRVSFGATLCELFFFPFHDRYTAGMSRSIAPQDDYKSPAAGGRGYNSTFRYPICGLDGLAARLAERCDIRYGKRLVGIDSDSRVLLFADGSESGYDQLLSTLPLHQASAMAAVDTEEPPDPYTSVLVLNIGAERGPACPDAHWQYEPDSSSGFHRIGFYSNVDPDFLPAGCRNGSHVSMYVERAFIGGQSPSPVEIHGYIESVIDELQTREYIGRAEVVDPSWVEVAYTWRSPGSRWRERALQALTATGIQQVGRYGRWHFQGIADSIRDGLQAGEALQT